MNPILYGATEKMFETQGLGALSEAISCKVTEERNGSYELEMVYPQSGKRFKDLLLNRIIKAVPAYRKDPEPFRIYYMSKPFNGKVTVKAEHISYQLSYIPVRPFTANNVIEAMENLKQYSAEDNPFTFWTSKETKAKMSFDVPRSCRALLGGTSGSILDTYLGEYEFNGYAVKLHDHRGVDKGVTIRYGKNLTDIKQEESIANTITGICPYWKSEETGEVVTLPETTVSSDKANNFPYKRTVPHDFTASFEEKPTEAQLREKAQAYVRQTGFGVPDVSIDVSFVMLSQFEGYKDIALLEVVNLCDTVSVYFEPLEISAKAKVIKTVYNVLNDAYDSITLGNAKASFTKVIEDIKQDTDDKITEETNARKKAIAELVKKVEAGKGLYLTDKGQDGAHDWFLHDKPELADSSTIIRINDEGIIFSVDGGKTYNGLSWDGQAILDKIYVIGLDASKIKTGTLDAAIVTIKNLYLKDIQNDKGVSLDVTLQGIELEVSKKVGDSEIISKINQSAEEIQIEASRIKFKGSATFEAAVNESSKVQEASKNASAAATAAGNANTTVNNLKNGLSNGTTSIDGDCIKTGTIWFGTESFINQNGRFRVGPMYSTGGTKDSRGYYSNQDVCFDKAIFINYGVEIYGNNDSAEGISYIDFHSGSDVTTGDSLYDYTGRFQNYLAKDGVSQFAFTGSKTVNGTSAGTCTVAVNGNIVHSSDKRLKSDIKGLSADKAKNLLMALNPVSYKYKADSADNIHHGLIYQSVKEIVDDQQLGNLALLQEYMGADKVVYGAIGYDELIADIILVLQDHEKKLRGEK